MKKLSETFKSLLGKHIEVVCEFLEQPTAEYQNFYILNNITILSPMQLNQEDGSEYYGHVDRLFVEYDEKTLNQMIEDENSGLYKFSGYLRLYKGKSGSSAYRITSASINKLSPQELKAIDNDESLEDIEENIPSDDFNPMDALRNIGNQIANTPTPKPKKNSKPVKPAKKERKVYKEYNEDNIKATEDPFKDDGNEHDDIYLGF